MKKKLLLLTSMQMFFSYGYADFCCSLTDIVEDSYPYFEIHGEVCFLKPASDNLGWAVVSDYSTVTTPNWHIKRLNPNFQGAFEVGVRYFTPCYGIDYQFNWTHLRTHDSESVSVSPSLQWISPFSQIGTAADINELTEAHGSVKFYYDLLNLDVGTTVNIGSTLETRIFFGLSGVEIKESLFSTFENISSLPSITLDTTSTYEGIGPRFGFNCSYKICRSLNFVGQAATTLFFGRMQPAEYLFSGSSVDLASIGITSNDEMISSNSVTKAVPALDTKLGISYTAQFCKSYALSFEIGYRGAVYIGCLSGYESNTNTLALELGSLSTSSMKQVQSNFSVNGPYLQICLEY